MGLLILLADITSNNISYVEVILEGVLLFVKALTDKGSTLLQSWLETVH